MGGEGGRRGWGAVRWERLTGGSELLLEEVVSV